MTQLHQLRVMLGLGVVIEPLGTVFWSLALKSLWLDVCISVCGSLCMSASVYLSVCVCVFVCVPVCMSVYVGGNKISHAVTGAHDGAIFSICVVKDGTLMTGGKDRQLIEWNSAYQRTGRTHEV